MEVEDDDDEEVFLSKSELGKYINSLNVFGFQEESSPSADNDCPLRSINTVTDVCDVLPVVCPNFGFICGRNLFLVQFTPIFSVLNAFKSGFSWLNTLLRWQFIQNTFAGSGWLTLAEIRLKHFIQHVSIIIDKLIAKSYVLHWRKNNLSKRYSLEELLSMGNKELTSYNKMLCALMSRLNFKISQITTLQFSVEAQKHPFLRHLTSIHVNEPMNCRRELVREICKNSEHLKRRLEEVSNLVLMQTAALDRFLFDMRISYETQTSPKTEDSDVHEEEEEIEVSEEINLSPVIFETNEQQLKEISEVDHYISLNDEIFELEVKDQYHTNDVEFDAKDEVSAEVKARHAELLSQLQTTLLLRRAKMKEREVTAYIKMYGKIPDEDTEEEIEFSHLNRRPSPPTALRHRLCIDEEEFTYSNENSEDEIELTENNGISSDFSLFLQNILEKKES